VRTRPRPHPPATTDALLSLSIRWRHRGDRTSPLLPQGGWAGEALQLTSRDATGAVDVWRGAPPAPRSAGAWPGEAVGRCNWRGHGHPRRPAAAAGTHRSTTVMAVRRRPVQVKHVWIDG
jgi:hypothetical protein